jgi:site-specific recombinase XerD
MRFALTALRAFLRFTVFEGLTRPGLEQCVPAVPLWRLSALPRYLMPADVQRVIASCDLSKPIGIRDRAILLLLARLALRAGDIVRMLLADVDWSQGTLRVCGKGRREVLLPLPQEVGDAVFAYLRRVRPSAETNRLFLAVRAPIRPFAGPASISVIVRSALDRAGVKDPPSHGANLLRHSAATAMLRAGSSLETIATVLRHRSARTTAHYAKVDVTMLGQVVQPWPTRGAPC